MVYDDLSQDEGFREISIRDYAEKIRNNYPGGLKFNIDTVRIRLRRITNDQDARQILEVRTRKAITGALEGNEFSKSVRLVFLIG